MCQQIALLANCLLQRWPTRSAPHLHVPRHGLDGGRLVFHVGVPLVLSGTPNRYLPYKHPSVSPSLFDSGWPLSPHTQQYVYDGQNSSSIEGYLLSIVLAIPHYLLARGLTMGSLRCQSRCNANRVLRSGRVIVFRNIRCITQPPSTATGMCGRVTPLVVCCALQVPHAGAAKQSWLPRAHTHAPGCVGTRPGCAAFCQPQQRACTWQWRRRAAS